MCYRDGMTTTALDTLPPIPSSTLELAPDNLGRLVTAWLESLVSENTRNAYRTDWAQFAAWCAAQGGSPLAVNRAGIDNYRQGLTAAGRRPATIARKLAALASFYDYALDLDAVKVNPVAKVKRPKVSNDSQTLGLDKGDAGAFLAAAEAAGPRDYALACLLVLNGLRVSEALGIDVDAIRAERGHAVVDVTGKGDKVRPVVLAPMTIHAVESATVGRESGPVLVDNAGARLNRHQVARIVARLARAANVQNARKITPHSCRHTFVTLALDEGVPLHKVQDDAGHASPVTTQRYNRARQRLDDAATYALAAALAR